MSRASRRRRCPASSRRAPRANSAFASAAGSSGAWSTPAPSSARANRSPSSTRATSSCSSNRRRPSSPPRAPRWCRPKPRRSAITALTRQGWSANADFDKAKSAADQARAGGARAERAVSLAQNSLGYATLDGRRRRRRQRGRGGTRPGRRGRRAGRPARPYRREGSRRRGSGEPDGPRARGARRASNIGRCPGVDDIGETARALAQRRPDDAHLRRALQPAGRRPRRRGSA